MGRQLAQKANISLDLVDQFLDDVNDTIPSICPNSSSITDEHVLSWKSSLEANNEDDDDVAAFLFRVEGARIAAIENAAAEAKTLAIQAISAAAAEVEAIPFVCPSSSSTDENVFSSESSFEVNNAKNVDDAAASLFCVEGARIAADDTEESEELQSPVSEKLQSEGDEGNENTEEMFAFEVGQGVLSPTKFSKFIYTIDHQHANGVDQEHHLQQFKELNVPLVDGHKPTLIESAQIRQLAQKANISLDLVDQFLDDVNDTIPSICPNSSSIDEHVLSWKSSLEANNEDDDDVAAFLFRVEGARIAAIAET